MTDATPLSSCALSRTSGRGGTVAPAPVSLGGTQEVFEAAGVRRRRRGKTHGATPSGRSSPRFSATAAPTPSWSRDTLKTGDSSSSHALAHRVRR